MYIYITLSYTIYNDYERARILNCKLDKLRLKETEYTNRHTYTHTHTHTYTHTYTHTHSHSHTHTHTHSEVVSLIR